MTGRLAINHRLRPAASRHGRPDGRGDWTIGNVVVVVATSRLTHSESAAMGWEFLSDMSC